MIKKFAFCTVLMALTSSVTAEVNEYAEFKGWEIDSYTHDANKDTYACRGYMYYEGGMSFAIGFKRGRDNEPGLSIRFWHDNWASIEQDKEYEITFEFPRREPWRIMGTGMAEPKDTFYGINMFYELDDDTENFIQDFRKTSSMRLYVEGNEIGYYSLKGTMGMMQLAAECYQKRVKTQKRDPFSSSSSGKNNDPFDL